MGVFCKLFWEKWPRDIRSVFCFYVTIVLWLYLHCLFVLCKYSRKMFCQKWQNVLYVCMCACVCLCVLRWRGGRDSNDVHETRPGQYIASRIINCLGCCNRLIFSTAQVCKHKLNGLVWLRFLHYRRRWMLIQLIQKPTLNETSSKYSSSIRELSIYIAFFHMEWMSLFNNMSMFPATANVLTGIRDYETKAKVL